MAIVNRDLDASQQKDVYNWKNPTGISYTNIGVATGWTQMCWVFPYQGAIQSIKAGGLGLSGAMQLIPQIYRMAGGFTVISIGISNLVLGSISTSGMMSYSGMVLGSTLLNVLPGDIFAFQTAVANTAATDVMIEMIVKKTQDIVAHNGVST